MTSSGGSNLLLFPPRPPAPVSAQHLRENSREILKIEALEAEILADMQTARGELLKLKGLKENAKKERTRLLERLARGARLAG